MSSLPSASFEAKSQGRQLPNAALIKLSVRDHLIVDWFISDQPPLIQRMAVLYGYKRDERLLDVLSALHYAHPKIRANVIGVSEAKGRLHTYYGCPLSLTEAQRALGDAAYKALYPTDRWQVDLTVVPTRNGQLDRSRLPEKHPLLTVPVSFQLGLIEVRP